ncbi:hypothetical protein RCL1_003459 [Eukaryota sp. TZLM3-RCL]
MERTHPDLEFPLPSLDSFPFIHYLQQFVPDSLLVTVEGFIESLTSKFFTQNILTSDAVDKLSAHVNTGLSVFLGFPEAHIPALNRSKQAFAACFTMAFHLIATYPTFEQSVRFSIFRVLYNPARHIAKALHCQLVATFLDWLNSHHKVIKEFLFHPNFADFPTVTYDMSLLNNFGDLFINLCDYFIKVEPVSGLLPMSKSKTFFDEFLQEALSYSNDEDSEEEEEEEEPSHVTTAELLLNTVSPEPTPVPIESHPPVSQERPPGESFAEEPGEELEYRRQDGPDRSRYKYQDKRSHRQQQYSQNKRLSGHVNGMHDKRKRALEYDEM